MVHDGKRNNREVLIECERCGVEHWVRWQRVKEGRGRFCSLSCANKVTSKSRRKNFGKENASFVWNMGIGTWSAYWKDSDGVQHTTTKARWLWEMENGDVPDGYVVTYKDRNPENCELENLELITRGDRTSEVLMGHVMSDETKQKLSDAHKGKTLSDEHKEKIRSWTISKWEDGTFGSDKHLSKLKGKPAWNKGLSHTKESRQKMSESQKRIYDDPEEVERLRLTKARGSKHHNWKGGLSEQKYPPEFSKSLRKKIRERDNHKCQICKKSGRGMRGRVHHIDADKHNNEFENLILLCNACHGKIHATYKTDDVVILAFRSMLQY